jgi:dienelactone hydrolase
VRNAWAGRADHKVVVYRGADHAFAHDPDRPAHLADAAADAWRRCLAFLLD